MSAGHSLTRGPNAVRNGSRRHEGAGRDRTFAAGHPRSGPDVYGRREHGPSEGAVAGAGERRQKAGASAASIGTGAETMGVAALAARVSGADATAPRLRSRDRPEAGKRGAASAGIARRSVESSLGVRIHRSISGGAIVKAVRRSALPEPRILCVSLSGTTGESAGPEGGQCNAKRLLFVRLLPHRSSF